MRDVRVSWEDHYDYDQYEDSSFQASNDEPGLTIKVSGTRDKTVVEGRG